MGSDKEEISFTISAPCFNALIATSDFLVSTDIPILGNSSLIISIALETLSNSSFNVTSVAPGRVDSPPISIQSAPFSDMKIALSNISSKLLALDLSKKESGVTLMTPIILGKPLSRHFIIGRQSAILSLYPTYPL